MLCSPRTAFSCAVHTSGTHNKADSGLANEAGMTPITVYASPSRWIVFPTTFWSPPNCEFHSRYESTATCWPPDTSSLAPISRPSNGRVPRSEKNVGSTRAARSARALQIMLDRTDDVGIVGTRQHDLVVTLSVIQQSETGVRAADVGNQSWCGHARVSLDLCGLVGNRGRSIHGRPIRRDASHFLTGVSRYGAQNTSTGTSFC